MLVEQVVAAPPIRKALPARWFIDHGGNAEMRWEAMRDQGYLTPNERFFVRNHTRTPEIDPATWRLPVHGPGVRRDLELAYRDLEALAVDDVQSVIECAGSGGRDLFGAQQGTPVAGTPWKLGGIGAARWRGVPLRTVLELAGLKDEAVDVMAHGLDDPYICDGIDHGPVRRPLPVGKALDDVLVAFEMNGEALPPDHGFPARLVVPGWVGVASVKWLGALEVSDSRLWSPWNTRWYAGLTVQPVKSAFELPWEATLEAGRCTTLTGRAWSGGAAIACVDVSTDGGDTWQRARLRGPNRRNVWARFELEWTPAPGRHELLARATDLAGLRQPDAVPLHPFGYQFWAVVRHPVAAL
jgi:DMSO/TMAO reductase YedYZ molybdopterin-dependent catalytic subunit